MNNDIIIIGSARINESNLFNRDAKFKFVNLSFKQVKGEIPKNYELFVSKYLVQPSGDLSEKSKRILDESKLDFKQIKLKINLACMIWIIRKIGFSYFTNIYIQSKSEFYRELKRWSRLNPSISTGFKVILLTLIDNNKDNISCYGFSLDQFSNYSWFDGQSKRGHVIQDKILYKYLVDEGIRFVR